MFLSGELWTDKQGVSVRRGADFYKCSYDLLPTGSRAHDTVVFSLTPQNTVEKILSIEREVIHRRPSGFAPPKGVFVGKVTSYLRNEGWLDYDTPFASSVVKAIGQGEVQVGEIVEYTLDDVGAVSKVTGPFGTHVTATGRRLK